MFIFFFWIIFHNFGFFSFFVFETPQNKTDPFSDIPTWAHNAQMDHNNLICIISVFFVITTPDYPQNWFFSPFFFVFFCFFSKNCFTSLLLYSTLLWRLRYKTQTNPISNILTFLYALTSSFGCGIKNWWIFDIFWIFYSISFCKYSPPRFSSVFFDFHAIQ